MSCSQCTPYVFEDGFLDWQVFTDSEGDDHYFIGFGNTAGGPIPVAASTALSVVLNPNFNSVLYVDNDCGCTVAYVFSNVEGPEPLGWMSGPLVA